MADLNALLEQSISSDLKWNLDQMEQILGTNIDVMKRRFMISDTTPLRGVCFFVTGLVNVQRVDNNILDPLMNYKGNTLPSGEELIDKLQYEVIVNTDLKPVKTFNKGLDGLMAGDTLVFFEKCEIALLVSTRGWDARAVGEPATEPVVRGPRDGFTEDIRTNTALVRRRIRDPLLRIDSTTVGSRSKTDVNIAYIEGVVKEGLVDEVKQRLSRIKIDAVLESGYIEELIEDEPLSPFTTVQSTERPDKVASALLEGRVAIFVDNTPFVLMVPSMFWQFFQASDDYYSRYWVGSFFRIVRFIAFIISLTLPSIYVMLVSFHHEMIPTPLALSIAAGRESVPFPALLEALVMETAFELMREAGLRMPKPIGQAVSIVGSLVIGQAAVQAGLVSPAMVIVIALTGMSSFAIPNYATSFAIRILRFPLLLASGFMGLLGFAAMFSMFVIHALSIRSFGESYLAPATPFRPTDQKDIILRVPWWQMKQRPSFDTREKSTRQEPSLMPHAPKDKRVTGAILNPFSDQVTDEQQSTENKPNDKKVESKEDESGSKQESDNDKKTQSPEQKSHTQRGAKKKVRPRKEYRDREPAEKKERTWRKTKREE